jgi:hypothetical protein
VAVPTGLVTVRRRVLGHHPKLLKPLWKVDLDQRAGADLAAPPGLWLAIDTHCTARYQRLGLDTVRDDVGELEQLSQADDVPADFDLHTASVDHR